MLSNVCKTTLLLKSSYPAALLGLRLEIESLNSLCVGGLTSNVTFGGLLRNALKCVLILSILDAKFGSMFVKYLLNSVRISLLSTIICFLCSMALGRDSVEMRLRPVTSLITCQVFLESVWFFEVGLNNK